MGLSNQSNNKPLLRRQKGWYGFVHNYPNYVKNVDWDKIEWGKGTEKPKSVEVDAMGKQTIKF